MAENRRRNVVRYVLVIVGILVVVGMPAALKYRQIKTLVAHAADAERAGPPPEAVGSATAKLESWENTLEAVGSVAPVSSVVVANDAPGIVEEVRFNSGDRADKGDVLVTLDASAERARLAEARARRDLAVRTARRSKALVEQGALERAQLDQDAAARKAAEAEVAALAAEVERKTVRAPFAGRLGLREVRPGQYLGPGTRVTVLDATQAVSVDFTLPQDEIAAAPVGTRVRLRVRGAAGLTADGVVVASEPTIDDVTRSVRVRAQTQNADLRPGMFVEVVVVRRDRALVVAVPATAIVHASYGDSVFVVAPGAPGMAATPDGKPVKVARQAFVRVGPARGDYVGITAGLAPGQEVVTAGAFKLRNGAPIVIDNSVAPVPALAPRPEDR